MDHANTKIGRNIVGRLVFAVNKQQTLINLRPVAKLIYCLCIVDHNNMYNIIDEARCCRDLTASSSGLINDVVRESLGQYKFHSFVNGKSAFKLIDESSYLYWNQGWMV